MSSRYLPVRQVSRALDRIDADAAVATGYDRARIDRISETTQHGMLAVAQLASMEAAMCELAPHARGRIQAVGVAGAMGIVNTVHRAGLGW